MKKWDSSRRSQAWLGKNVLGLKKCDRWTNLVNCHVQSRNNYTEQSKKCVYYLDWLGAKMIWSKLLWLLTMKKICKIKKRMFQIMFKDTINPLQLFIFTNVLRCSRLALWVGYFICLKFIRVSSIVYQSLYL